MDRGARRSIWDLPLRLFHWMLVALICFSWWSGKHHDMERHRLSGYAILALLTFRIYWGFFGGYTARFGNFVRGPRTVLAYGRSLASRAKLQTAGHNPAGGWSVVLMLAALLAMVVAGLFAVDVDGLESGPLSDFISFDQGRLAAHIHAYLFNLLLALIALHLVAIAFYGAYLRHNLIGPMVHGRGPLPQGDERGTPWSPWKALIGLLLAAASAYAVSHSFRF